MESLVYLQLCCLHDSSSPPLAHSSPRSWKSATLLAAALFLASASGPSPVNAQAFGDRSDEVQRLQFRLQVLGYEYVQPTGVYDFNTQQAVIDFQQRNGLAADGIVGRQTRPLLFGKAVDPYWNPSIPNARAPETWNVPSRSGPPSQPFAFPPEGTNSAATLPQFPATRTEERAIASSLLRPGDRSESVRILQRRLRELGYYYGNIDGIYGGTLKSAVERFQAANFLAVDGMAGANTLAALGLSNLAPTSVRGYIVVIPGGNDTLYQVQGYISSARLQNSRRGNFVNAGQFSRRNDAEERSFYLRSRGFDARVAYNP